MPSLRITSENQGKIHFMTLTCVAWLDIFTSRKYFELLLDSLKYCQKSKSLTLYEYVFMTNHIHLICSVSKGLLSQVVSDFKKYTTREVYKMISSDNRDYLLWVLRNSYQKDREGQLWQSNNYPEIVEGEQFYNIKQNYIYNNPVEKGYVEKPEDWLYTSARNRIKSDNTLINLENIYQVQ
jgi:putative transposase